MQRAVASLLIALVGLMAWLPQALCPCAQRARAEQAQAEAAGVVAPKACCPMCAAREAALAHRAADGREAPGRSTGSPASRETPPTCPCCEINGGGKYLLQLGGVVRPEPDLQVVLFAAQPLLAVLDLYQPARVCVRALDDLPDDAAPALRRAGVVLLI